MQKTILELAKTNSYDYNLRKSIEECQELALVLMQRLNKPNPQGPSNQDIIDEIGDVQIRVLILAQLFGPQNVERRVKEKIEKYSNLIRTKKYIGTI